MGRISLVNGADTSEDADSVAWDGGVSLMAGLSISGLQTLLRCCSIDPCLLGCGGLKERRQIKTHAAEYNRLRNGARNGSAVKNETQRRGRSRGREQRMT